MDPTLDYGNACIRVQNRRAWLILYIPCVGGAGTIASDFVFVFRNSKALEEAAEEITSLTGNKVPMSDHRFGIYKCRLQIM